MTITHRTAAEILIKYKLEMGDELGEAFHHCRQQLFDLSITWDQYETLFQNSERPAVMNKSGSSLALNIQRHFYTIVIMGITRLLDPITTGKNRNLVLELLPQLAENECKTISLAMFGEIKKSSIDLITARNKILAHNDYDQSTNREAKLGMGSRIQTTDTLKNILKFLNIFEHYYCKSSTVIFPMGNDDAALHLHYLDHGLRIRTVIETDVKSGKSDWPEFRKPVTWLQLSKNETERYT